MKTLLIPALTALAFSLVPAQAGTLLLDNVTGNTGGIVDETRPADSGILAEIQVGANPVAIDDFGVYGELATSGNLNWAIFLADGTRVFDTGLVAEAAGTSLGWYDAPAFSPLALSANTTYYFGVISDSGFTYQWYSPAPMTFTGGGLTSPGGNASGSNGNFTDTVNPTFSDACCGVQQGTRIFGADAVPEPSSALPLTLILVAAGVVIRKRNAVKLGA
ncbi:MAG: PEP-CTERM sorting domain-containing protein [Bryobacteraceae bacterium]